MLNDYILSGIYPYINVGMIAGLGSLTWPSRIGLWDWMRLQNGCTLSNKCAQVKPDITTYAQRELPCCHVAYMATWSTRPYIILGKTYNKLEEPNTSQLGVAE